VLTAAGISRRHGAADVLRDVSLTVAPRRRIGVVGPNGIGKSTLLRILAGEEAPDAGAVRRAPRDLEVGRLPQEPDALPGETLGAYLARRTGVAAAEARMDALAARLHEGDDAVHAYTEALERFLHLGGDDHAARAETAVRQVGLPPEAVGRPVATLSGGNAARAGLAALLVARFDVFLLDEPTNNLDFAGLEVLERFVRSTDAAVVAVSHDRAFLARCCDTVVELEPGSRSAAVYHGGWEAYLAARAAARDQARAAFEGYVSERDRLRESAQRVRLWSESGAKRAKKDFSKDKIARRGAAEGAQNLAGKSGGAARRLERLERTGRVDKPFEPWELRLKLAAAGRGGDVVLRLSGAVVERGDFRIGPVDLEVGARERVAFVGRNGCGKSSLLGAALGRVPLASGERYAGPGQRIGELDQLRGTLTGDRPLVEVFRDRTGMAEAEARSALAKFGMLAEEAARAAGDLSPGERTRALLALLAGTEVTCLVLDEPTNHLDLEAIEQLESALEVFDGTLVVVSHDRAFLDALRLERTIDVEAFARSGPGQTAAHGAAGARVPAP
jgi:ATPase subunit of ABC transporter with duplicated ATPase domains